VNKSTRRKFIAGARSFALAAILAVTAGITQGATPLTFQLNWVAGGPNAAVEIVDDGSGPGGDDDGRGLAGLRERASRLGGSVDAGPLPGGGFRLRVEVPVA